jgi:hypothetical protein
MSTGGFEQLTRPSQQGLGALGRKLDALRHLLANLPRPLLLQGPHGSGKTALLRLLQAHGHEAWQVCYIAADANLTLARTVDEILRLLRVPQQSFGEASLETLLAERMAALEQRGESLVLIVDDAGVLMPGLLAALCQLAHLHPAIKLAFSLRPEDLPGKQLTDGLALAEAHILRLAPETEAVLYAPPAPSPLPAAYAAPPAPPPAKRPAAPLPAARQAVAPRPMSKTLWIVGGVSLLALAGTGAGLFMLWPGQPSAPILPSPPARPSLSLPAPLAPQPPAPPQAVEPPQLESAAPPPSPKTLQPAAPITDTSKPPAAAEEEASLPAQPAAETAADAKPPVPVAGTDAAKAPALLPPANPTPAATAAQPASSQLPQAAPPAATPPPSAPQSQPEAPPRVAKPKPAAKPPPAAPAKPREPALPLGNAPEALKGAAWLLAQDPGAYSLQLVAVSRLDSVLNFIRRVPASDELASFRSSKGAHDLYPLFYGIYPSLAAAKAAAAQLPAALGPPVARQLKSIQQEIQRVAPLAEPLPIPP